ncbi:MAG: ankyrin repeat domain-containing protein, partial [Acidobacteriota bacterium]
MKVIYRVSLAGLLPAMFAISAAAQNAEVMNRWYESIRQNDVASARALLRTTGSNPRDERGSTPLIYAAAVGSPEMVELLLTGGAEVNAQNAFGVSPLMLAITEPSKVRTLVSHGADVNAKSKVGRTPLLLASMADGASASVRLLIAKGAAVAVRDEATKLTPLLAATAANDTQTVEILLARNAPVNDRDISGVTPLMNASANGNLKVMRGLLLRGAEVNAVTNERLAPPVKNGPMGLGSMTALMMAATTGGSGAVRLLLDSGAKVNEKDVRGMTALMLALTSDHADAKSVETLLAHGADATMKDGNGLSAVAWAKKFGRPDILRALSANETVSANPRRLELAAYVRPDMRQAVAGSTALLQRASQGFLKEGGCVSCHAQELTAVAVHAAQEKGVMVDEKIRQEQRCGTELQFASGEYMLMQRLDPPAVEILTYGLYHLAVEKAPPSRTTDAVLHNLVAQQRQDGGWDEVNVNRAPMADGSFSRTALAIRAMREYGSKGRAADLHARIERAAAWLAKLPPATTEDRVMQMLGLAWANSREA